MSATTFVTSRKRALLPVLPGLILCLAVTSVALALEGIEEYLFGRAWLEALVLAIVLGTVSTWQNLVPAKAKPVSEKEPVDGAKAAPAVAQTL